LANIWPDAPIYASIYRPDSTFDDFSQREVHTTFLQRLPVDRRFRMLLPLYPAAFHSLGTLDYEVVISSSSGWAHGVRTAPEALHVVYCHAPARWLYSSGAYLGQSFSQRLAAPITAPLRRWDQAAARRPDIYLANSANTAAKILAAYNRPSIVVPPPVAVERFAPKPRGQRLLVVSRLLDYKRVDAVIRAVNRAHLPLDVVGTGPSLGRLRQLAGETVTFHGHLSDDQITELMEQCSMFVLPGEEDFGITAVEAQAAGKPVVALAAGGALETVRDGVTGAFFESHDDYAVLDAIARADRVDTAPDAIADWASTFSTAAFKERIRAAIAEGLHSRSRKAIER
jgi:glycosyltransferase involved in cell wall biosynthesis